MNDQADKTDDLRRRAEQRLAAKQASLAGTAIDEKRLLHELQVHQIELEMQNEALREARLQSEIALERFTELFDFAPVPYFSLCSKGIIQQANFRSESLLGVERAKLSGQNFAHWVTGVFQLLFKNFLAKVFANTDSHSCEMTLQIGNDQKWVHVEGIADKTGDSCLLAVSDISERKRNEQELQLAATVFLGLEEAVMVTDKDNRIVTVNPAFTRLTGYLSDEAVGQSTALLKSGRHDEFFYEAMQHSLNTTGHWQGEIWTKRKNGEEFLEWLSINTLYSQNGEVIRRIATATDITDKKRMEEILCHQAHFDQLTGLPNRYLFLDRLQRAINKSNRTGRQLALMFLDLDHFKDVNDSLGHDAGDELLKEATQRLKGCLRETDTLARPGGDEFTIIMDELDEFNGIDRVAQNMVECITAPFIVKKERCYISVSIGIALYPSDADNLEELLKKADQAMYGAKNQGRSRYCY
ncbi:MAG: diguanylate cyclase, partial [Methylomicrobium sp.]|nr:diguanylate cyclase [Methylomicrobium sp.]